MAWARIDDNFFNHPKVRKAGKGPVVFYMAALCYSNAFLTEGFITDDMLDLIGAQAFQNRPRELADRLVECGLFDRFEGGYMIHDFLDYNYSKQQIDEIKSKRSDAGKQGGRPTKANVKQNESKTEANVKQNESHTHTHTHPIPQTEKEQEAAAAVSESFPANPALSAYERNIGVATPGTLALIDAAVKDYPAGWVEDAIREAAGNNARSWNYIAKILGRWQVEGRAPKNGRKQPGADIERFRELYREQKRGAA